MPGNLHTRVAKLKAQAGAEEEQYDREWWRRPGAVEEAQRGGKRKLAAALMGFYEQRDPEYLAVCFTDYPGWPDAYTDEDERTEIILKELFHKNPELKADINHALKEQMRADGIIA